MSTNETQPISDKALKRQERDAARRLADLAAAGDPGRGVSRVEAQKLRDERIQAVRAAKAEAEAARSELAHRESEKQTIFGRIFATEAAKKRRRDNAPTVAEAERREFHRELKAEKDKQNEREHERRRAAGLVWEPTGPAGGLEVAAVFSSASLWEGTEKAIKGGELVEPSLHLRDIAHLWWALNTINAGGGSVAIPAGRIPPRWPSYDVEALDGIKYREEVIAHLAKLGYLAIERDAGGLTITYGPRTKALAESYRDQARRTREG